MIDLRSDTVTIPTAEMCAAMANAPVGDDVYGEDPTINRLEELGAAMMGKQAGLFVPSGTMGNLAAVMAHCGRGDEVILGSKAHTFLYEAGGISALGGIHSCQIANRADGTMPIEEIAAAIRGENIHFPKTRLICLENTQNRCGGVVLPLEYHQAVYDLAHQRGIPLHLDGARIFNAAVALEIPARKFADLCDSITFCLSKGLCAPVGSILCGTKDFVDSARRVRKQLGGGMRQAGVLAAAGIVALESMIDRLADDHRRAKTLAEGLSRIPGLALDMGMPQSNMVFLRLSGGAEKISGTEIVAKLKERGVMISIMPGAANFRLVTHYYIDDQAVADTIAAFQAVLAG